MNDRQLSQNPTLIAFVQNALYDGGVARLAEVQVGATRQVSVRREHWRMKAPFQITGRLFTQLDCLVVELGENGRVGRGEAAGVYYLGDTVESAEQQVEALIPDLEAGLDRETLQAKLPAGGARNAIDCALWDLECKLAGKTIWQRTKAQPRSLLTCQTIGITPTPADSAAAAAALKHYRLLKLKLDGDRPIDRVRAVRAARPDARLIVDANQGFTLDQLKECLPEFAKCEIEMIEQPLPRGGDAGLEGLPREVPLCADESCLDRSELDAVANRYDMINIKLDKTGGLTEALLLAEDARGRGLEFMVGNMLATSLGMAPAYIVALQAKIADLDGPVALCRDRIGGLRYDHDKVEPFTSDLWG